MVVANQVQVFLVLVIHLVVNGLDVALGEGFDGVSGPGPEERHDEEHHDARRQIANPVRPDPGVGEVMAKQVQVVQDQMTAHLGNGCREWKETRREERQADAHESEQGTDRGPRSARQSDDGGYGKDDDCQYQK